MHNKLMKTLATEVAMNQSISGLKQNFHRRLKNYQNTMSQNAFISFDDSVLHQPNIYPVSPEQKLYGLPFSCKDNINAKGFATTAGTEALSHYYPDEDAPIIARLKQQGAVLIGKNNMHELSFGVTSYNKKWGNVSNPYNMNYIAGGSSGGSAAAVAAGVSAFAVGTDTGGSVRIPASLCGVTGFRPSTGRYPRSGIVPVSHSKDTPGFIAPTVEDIALLDSALMNDVMVEPVALKRIGVPEHYLWKEIDPHVNRTCRDALGRLEANGVELVPLNDSLWGELNGAIQFPVPFYEFFVDFPRFLLEQKLNITLKDIMETLGDSNVRRILENQLQHGSVSWDDYANGLHTIHSLRCAWAAAFQELQLDAIAYPTVSCPVPSHDKIQSDEIFEQLVRNTDIASSVGAPSLTIPIAQSGTLPVGLSLDGMPGKDRTLVGIGLTVSRYLNQI